MVQTLTPSPLTAGAPPGLQEAWQLVLGRLRPEMSKALFETWVEPLRALSYRGGVVTLGAANPYGRDWVDSRLKSSLASLLAGVYGGPVQVEVVVSNPAALSRPLPADEPKEPQPPAAEPPPEPAVLSAPAAPAEPAEAAEPPETRREAAAEPAGSRRKVMLQRAYGSRRAADIQPERGMFLTMYFFNKWLPRLGHSAATIILAARSMCYWNPLTGELRNTVETEMSELAQRAAVSVRTVKDVLGHELVQRYFLRYKVRRVMTSNGVRTAGITLQVRMDDPLTPEDQAEFSLPESERWYTSEFDDEEEEE